MSFGSTPTSTTPLSTNQFPVSSVAVPNHSGGNLTALRGLNPQSDSNGNEEADAAVALNDGADICQGLTSDSAVTGDNAGTISAKLRGLLKIVTDVWDSVNHRLHVNVDGGTVVAQAVAGTALGADQTNSELRVSLYATNATAGDTAVGVTGGNSLKVNVTNAQLPGNITQVGGNTVVTGGASGLLAIAGPVASGGANADNPVKQGGVFNTTQPTVTNGQVVDLQATARGARIVATGVDGFSVTANAGTNLNTSLLALESGGNLATLAGGISSSKYQMNLAQVLGAALSNTNPVLTEPNVQNWIRSGQQGYFASTDVYTPANINNAFSIFNPNASGKTLIIISMTINYGAAAQVARVRITNANPSFATALTNAAFDLGNLNTGGSTSPVASVTYATASTAAPALSAASLAYTGTQTVTAGPNELIPPGTPLVLVANTGLAVYFTNTAVGNLCFNVKWIEI